ncbi:MAG: hypothetical protein WD628_07080 [Thermomicrobiales bacterium]
MSVERDALQIQVERVRSALLARHGYSPGMELPREATRSPLEDVQRLATVSAHWGIASDLAIVGRFLVLFRRVLRIGLRWYINPIVDQQNAFNDAVVRALHDLQTENESLRSMLEGINGPDAQPERPSS